MQVLVVLQIGMAAGGSGTERSAQACPDQCQLLGKCIDGVCQCDPGWSGDACGTLLLGDSTVIWPSTADDGVSASWGASMLPANPNSTAAESLNIHLFANTVCRRVSCAHTQSAQIVHAVSTTGVRGPFQFKVSDCALAKQFYFP